MQIRVPNQKLVNWLSMNSKKIDYRILYWDFYMDTPAAVETPNSNTQKLTEVEKIVDGVAKVKNVVTDVIRTVMRMCIENIYPLNKINLNINFGEGEVDDEDRHETNSNADTRTGDSDVNPNKIRQRLFLNGGIGM